jgi:hypothetical protein
MTETSPGPSVTRARQEHLVPGREIHIDNLRGRQFCEVALITGSGGDDAVANVWNTTGASDLTAEQLDALDADALARESGALSAWIGPVRHWVIDELDVREAGDDKRFGAVTGTWTGAMEAGSMTSITPTGDHWSYNPGYVYCGSTFTFHQGSEVYVLDAPDGEAYVMESFTRRFDPALAEANLAHLGGRLDLPDGWGFRTEVLERDMTVSTAGHDNLAHVVQDNLHNVYQGSDAGRAFTDICRQDSLS